MDKLGNAVEAYFAFRKVKRCFSVASSSFDTINSTIEAKEALEEALDSSNSTVQTALEARQEAEYDKGILSMLERMTGHGD